MLHTVVSLGQFLSFSPVTWGLKILHASTCSYIGGREYWQKNCQKQAENNKNRSSLLYLGGGVGLGAPRAPISPLSPHWDLRHAGPCRAFQPAARKVILCGPRSQTLSYIGLFVHREVKYCHKFSHPRFS